MQEKKGGIPGRKRFGCKKDLPPRGLSFLENICDNSEVPVYAIGGMTKEREPEVMRKGASGICIMSGCMRE